MFTFFSEHPMAAVFIFKMATIFLWNPAISQLLIILDTWFWCLHIDLGPTFSRSKNPVGQLIRCKGQYMSLFQIKPHCYYFPNVAITMMIYAFVVFTARCYASAVLAMGLCLSVSVCVRLCPSVRLSQVGVLLKQLNRGSHKQHHTIAQRI